MEIPLGVGLTVYSIGVVFGVSSSASTSASRAVVFPSVLRLPVAILAAILWPLGFSLYGPLMGWKRRRDRRSFAREQLPEQSDL